MNKKRLSVVMAGAMLASSVSPVLAAEEVSVTEVQKGNLISDLTDKLWSAPRFSEVKDDRVPSTLQGRSTYALVVDGGKLSDTEEAAVINATVIAKNTKADLQAAIKTLVEKAEVAGKTVNLVNLGSREDKDKDGNTLVLSTESTTYYTEAELANKGGRIDTELNNLSTAHSTQYGNIIKDHGYVAGKGHVIYLQNDIDFNGDGKNDSEIVLTTSSERLDFTRFYNKADSKPTGFATVNTSNFGGFVVAAAENTDIADKVEAKYEISTDGINFKLSDLFDGVMLTEKGQSLLNAANDTFSVASLKDSANISTRKAKIVKFDGQNTIGTLKKENGLYKVKVEIADADRVADAIDKSEDWTDSSKKCYNTYYVTGESEKEIQKILGWIDALEANVSELSGEDRYATAVRIAKETAKLTALKNASNTGTPKYNIVLVNGNSLVDGLAAAPLAKHLAKQNTSNAPILLTEKNSLPRATKKYLNDLIDGVGNSNVTVHIVGGTGVVSKSIERELKDLNLKIERFGGEDREATSMAVAEEVIGSNDLTKAFVVGATGEADAMSIAGYAAETTTPIVVSGFEGLSEDTLESLEGARVNVIGGDSAVSEADYAAIKDVALTLGRVSGSDRKATNAAVINRFYNDNFSTKSVIVAKDDVLIDALTASNLAVEADAPIVLGTKELSKEQVDAVARNAKTAQKVYQVGHGVERSVVKTVAQALGLI